MVEATVRVRACLAVVGATLAFGLFAAAVPATSDAAFTVRNVWSGWCLDSNFNGDVYLNRCTPNNRYQQWERAENGFTKNVATGGCMTDVSGPTSAYGFVYTTYCNTTWGEQRWHNPYRGWFRRPPFYNVDGYNHGMCLYQETSNVHSVKLTRCDNPGGVHPTDQYWYWTAV